MKTLEARTADVVPGASPVHGGGKPSAPNGADIGRFISQAHWTDARLREYVNDLSDLIDHAETTEEANTLADIAGNMGHRLLDLQDRARETHTRLNDARRWRQ